VTVTYRSLVAEAEARAKATRSDAASATAVAHLEVGIGSILPDIRQDTLSNGKRHPRLLGDAFPRLPDGSIDFATLFVVTQRNRSPNVLEVVRTVLLVADEILTPATDTHDTGFDLVAR
jgi:hypothetical protein